MTKALSRNAGRAPLLLVTAIVLSVMAACASFVKPESFSERLAAGYIAHTAVLKATTNALAAHDISSADAEGVQKIAAEGRKVLDGAKLASEAGDLKTAEGRIAMATAILAELQIYLRERGPQ